MQIYESKLVITKSSGVIRTVNITAFYYNMCVVSFVSEQIGSTILEDLHSQRETIQRSRDRVSSLTVSHQHKIWLFIDS